MAPRDSILIGLGDAIDSRTVLDNALLDSLARLLDARITRGELASCGSAATTSGRAERAKCAMGTTQYYLEISEVALAATRGRATVVIMRRADSQPPPSGLKRVLGRVVARAVGRSREPLFLNMRSVELDLSFDGNTWHATPGKPVTAVSSPHP